LRKWSCNEVNGRIAAAEAPTGCEDAWRTATNGGQPATGTAPSN
jgi:hypothetical protein